MKSQLGELHILRRDKTRLEALTGYEVGELAEIVRLLRPRVHRPDSGQFGPGAAADAGPLSEKLPAGSKVRAVPEPLLARRRVEFVEDERGFTARLPPVLLKMYEAPRWVRWIRRLIPLWVGLALAMFITHAFYPRPWVQRVAGTCIFAVFVSAIAIVQSAHFDALRRRRDTSRPGRLEKSEPIVIDMQEDRLQRTNLRANPIQLIVPLEEVDEFRACATVMQREEEFGKLDVVLNDGRTLELVAWHEMKKLEEVATQFKQRLQIWRKRIGFIPPRDTAAGGEGIRARQTPP